MESRWLRDPVRRSKLMMGVAVLSVAFAGAVLWARIDVKATASLKMEVRRADGPPAKVRWEASTDVHAK